MFLLSMPSFLLLFVISDMPPVRGVWGRAHCRSHGVCLVANRNRNLHLFQCCQGQLGTAITMYHNPSGRAMILIILFNNACFNIALDADLSI